MNIVKISFKNVNNNKDKKESVLTNRWEECSAGTRSLWSQSCLTVISLSCERRLWSVSYLYSDNYMLLSQKESRFFYMQFPFLPLGLNWKVVKNVHCSLLLINTGLMSIGPLTKKLLQKHRPVSDSKKRRKRALSPRPLTESSAESEFSQLDTHWDGLCGLVLIRLSENYEKEDCETWSTLSFWWSHCLDFFGGKSIWSYWRLSLNVSWTSKTKPTALSVFICLMHVHVPAAAHSVF